MREKHLPIIPLLIVVLYIRSPIFLVRSILIVLDHSVVVSSKCFKVLHTKLYKIRIKEQKLDIIEVKVQYSLRAVQLLAANQ